MNKVQKLEQSLDFYKTKYDDYSNINEMNKELLKNNELFRNQIDELQKKNDLNELKIGKYIEKIDQIHVEKLNLELEISKNNSELLRIKQEISEFHEKILKKDTKIFELQSKLDSIQMMDKEGMSFMEDSPHKNLKNELNGLISDLSEVHEGNCQKNKIELLTDELQQKEKEIRLLMEKCKEYQNENSDLQMKNEKLSEENKRITGANKAAFNDFKRENKKLGEEIIKINQVSLFSFKINGSQFYFYFV